MKILWFTYTSSLFDKGKHHYHGVGWIESLEELIAKEPNIDLAVSFFHEKESAKKKVGGTTYYPILRKSQRKRLLKRTYNNWKGSLDDNIDKNIILNIIDDYQPDIIHVFGSENGFGEILKYTKTPVVIHLQGLINPCENAYFPPFINNWNFIFSYQYFRKNLLGQAHFFIYKRFKNQAKREVNILKNINYVMGRTEWDKSIAKHYNKQVSYFHVDEVLRSIFYESHNTQKPKSKKLTLVSTLSAVPYKGIDVVLKTAKLLNEELKINFEWLLIGIEKDDKLFQFFEKKFNINHQDVNIKCLGRQKPDNLINILTKSDIYIHPSYIDNSPNSVCEAQILGLPVIACNVGGVSSIVKNNDTGFLVPSNGVFEIGYIVNQISNKQIDYISVAQNGKKCAIERHDKKRITNNLILAYKNILK